MRRAAAAAIVTAGGLLAFCCWAWAAAGGGSPAARAAAAQTSSGGSDRLVIYIHAETDAEYRGNLRFFMQHAVQGDHGKAEYIFVMQVGAAVTSVVVSPSARAAAVCPGGTCAASWSEVV
jgi:hypothetical protein